MLLNHTLRYTNTYVIRTNKMHTFFIIDLIILSSTCFERPNVNPREDLHAIKLTPNYISIKINGNNSQYLKTIKQLHNIV